MRSVRIAATIFPCRPLVVWLINVRDELLVNEEPSTRCQADCLEMLLIIHYVKNHELPARRYLLLRIFFPFHLVDAVILGWIGH